MVRRACLPLFIAALLAGVSFSQDGEANAPPQPRQPPPIDAAMQVPVHISSVARVANGTEVSLRLTQPIKTKTAKVGDRAQFVLSSDLFYRNALLAPAGTPVHATVVEASRAKWASRGSKLAVEVTALQLLNGQRLPLRGYAGTQGGIGPTASAVGALIDNSGHCGVCFMVLVPTGLVSLLAPGSNKELEPFASAYVDGDFVLDPPPFQSEGPIASGRVRIVHGSYGWPSSLDLFCNGVPLVHLDALHKLELDLQPGYYRFSVSPGKDMEQIYVAPGSETHILTTQGEVRIMNDQKSSLKTLNPSISPSHQAKSEGQRLEKAHTVDPSDVYSTSCNPLPEVIDLTP
jgi:hypothetical protein